MDRLIFIRHSIPAVDPERPAREWMLSPEGREEAEALAARLATLGIERIVSSTEAKARQTAEVIAQRLALPLAFDHDLREHDRTTAPFLPRHEFEVRIAAFFATPDRLVFGEEMADQVLARFEAAIARARASATGAVALVTHGTAMTLHLARHASIEPLAFWKSMTMPMAVLLEDGALTVL